MKCPQCIENLGKSSYKGFDVGSCLYCDGIWVDKEVLTEILAKDPAAPSLDSMAAFFKGRRKSTRSCPSCGDRMRKNLVHDIELDFCLPCKGAFFDQGELKALAPNVDNQQPNMSTGAQLGIEAVFWIIIGIFVS